MRDSDLIIRWRMFEDPALALGLYVHHIQRHMPKKKNFFFKHKHREATVRVMKNTGVGFSYTET